MNRMRTWSLGAAVVAVLVLVAGWFLLISPTKAKVSDLHTQTATQQQTNAGLQTQISQLKIQNKGLPKQEAQLALIRQHLPSNPALPAFVRTLTLIAHEAGVKLVSVDPSQPSAVTIAAPVVVTPSPSASASSSSDSATTDPAAVTVAPAAPTSPLRMIPVAINVTGGYYNVVSFLNKVENLKRSMIVYGVNVTPNATATAAQASASPSASTVVNRVTAVLSTRIFYSPPVVTTPVTTPATGATPAASGSASTAAAS
jgi:Tfp pilus assembly protein PilO